MSDRAPIPSAKLRSMAVEASVDPRTIKKLYEGGKVRGMAYDRALAVLRAAGYEPVTKQGD